MAGRASIVGAAATHVGKVRDHNEDAHFLDVDLGVFLVCDGMGGHAAGEVASALAIQSIQEEWASDELRAVATQWLDRGTPEAKKQLLEVIRAGVIAAHHAILAEAARDEAKSGMGTTLVGAMLVGGELVVAHAGDSRAYLVRDGISMQLTEDHTLLARLMAAGIEVDVSGEGSRFRSMLTNALGIGEECKVATFVVPLADGDRFLLCSDGISEYVPENEVGEVLTKQPSPARAAQRLVDLALERGGGDNATAVVVRVLEAGETPLPAEQRTKDDAAVASCVLWGPRVTPQQRLRALRIAIPRDHNAGEKLPAHALGDRVAWIIVEGALVQDGVQLGPGALVYPESMISGRAAPPLPDRDALAVTHSEVRALAIRADDFRELCEDDNDLGEALLESLAQLIAKRRSRAATRSQGTSIDPRGNTDPHLPVVGNQEIAEAYHPTDPDMRTADEPTVRERVPTISDDEPTLLRAPIPTRPGSSAEGPPAMPATAQPSSSPAPRSNRASTPPPVRSPSGRTPPRPTPAPASTQLDRQDTALAGAASPPPAAEAGAQAARSDNDWDIPTVRSRPRTDPPPTHLTNLTNARPESSRGNHVIARNTVKHAPPALTPALHDALDGPTERTATPGTPGTRGAPPEATPPATHGDGQPSTDPEIETYLEIEAELPPEPSGGAAAEPQRPPDLALRGNLDDEHESMSITIEEDNARVTKTVTETNSQTVTLTVTEPSADEPTRPRVIIAQEVPAGSGPVRDRPSAPRRPKRPSEGWDK